MKKEFVSSLLLTVICIVVFSGFYTGVVWAIAQLSPNKGKGFIIQAANGKYYYENIGQSFTQDKYFWSRPSAVGYNAAGSGGSNKGPTDTAYLAQVQQRIDTFMKHNPGINKADIPSDMVTASGSGLDPDISMQGAMVQIDRIAKVRGMDKAALHNLVEQHIERSCLGMAPKKINVLKLNLDLDRLK